MYEKLPYLIPDRGCFFRGIEERCGFMYLKHKLLGNRKGQSMVETALILPIVVLLLTGIIDFGLLFNNYLVITNASREAARNAAVGCSDLEINMMVVNMTSTLDQSRVVTEIYPAQADRMKGQEVTITITYDNVLLTPLISSIVPNPLKLKSKTVMRIE
jgi:Flp pilus assembly protein TadG